MRNGGLILGIVSLVLAWGILPLIGESFSLHMIRHMLVVASGALGWGLFIFESSWDPSRKKSYLFSPIPVSILELVIVWGWHAPVPHHLARMDIFYLFLEQGSFLVVGVWLWLSAFRSPEAGIIGLLLTSMHMTFLGALLGMAPREIYHHGGSLGDLHTGGAVMILGGGFIYLLGGVVLTLKILRRRNHESLA